jgi:uncharacterized protein (DUF934 family)
MKFIDSNQDRWVATTAEDATAAALVPGSFPLLEWAQWQAVRATWPAGLPTGVLLPNDMALPDLAPDLPRLALVALQFPKWTDGRAYSQAHLLRARHRFGGEVRAVGDVVVDMLPLLHRSGFDAVALRPDQSLDAARRALTFFTAFYQGDVHEPRPRFARAEAA